MSEPITNLPAAVRELGALPVPVGPELKPLVLTEAQVEALAEAGNRVVNDAVHEDLCMCDGWPEKCVSTGGFRLGDWDVSGLETALPAVLALWEQMRGGELATLRARVAELEAEHAQLRDDITGACLARYEEEQENARLRLVWGSARMRSRRKNEALKKLKARVAELEAERHVTNEALDDAVQELRGRREAAPAETDTLPAWLYQRFMPHGIGWDNLDDGDRDYWAHEARAVRRAVARGGFKNATPEESADRLTRLLAPTQALREDEPHASPEELTERQKTVASPGTCGLSLLTGQPCLDHPRVPRASVEDPHDSPLHHDYLLSRDLPETGGER